MNYYLGHLPQLPHFRQPLSLPDCSQWLHQHLSSVRVAQRTWDIILGTDDARQNFASLDTPQGGRIRRGAHPHRVSLPGGTSHFVGDTSVVGIVAIIGTVYAGDCSWKSLRSLAAAVASLQSKVIRGGRRHWPVCHRSFQRKWTAARQTTASYPSRKIFSSFPAAFSIGS